MTNKCNLCLYLRQPIGMKAKEHLEKCVKKYTYKRKIIFHVEICLSWVKTR